MGIFFYGCITLDGYLADKNHGLDWLHQCATTEETDYEDFYRRMDVTIMGSRTFREAARLEHPEDVYPATQNYVFTHSPQPSRAGFHFVNGDVVEFVKQFDSAKNIWVIGGNTLLAPLLEENLVDYLIVQIAPVLLGDGIPLFTQGEALKRFRLDKVKQYDPFAELVYNRADG